MRTGIILAAAVIAIGAGSNTLAADHPTVGRLYILGDDSFLRYNCQLQGERLNCEFMQIHIVRGGMQKDLGNRLRSARGDFPNAAKEIPESSHCKLARSTRDFMTGKLGLKDAASDLAASDPTTSNDKAIETILRLADTWRGDDERLADLKTFIAFCDKPTEANYLRHIAREHATGSDSCTITSSPYWDSFVWSEESGIHGAWVADTERQGPCEIRRSTRIEPTQGSDGSQQWQYHVDRRIFNPSGFLDDGMACSLFDRESELDYVPLPSDAGTLKLDCTYVYYAPY